MANEVIIKASGGGMKFTSALALVFITLKLVGAIAWSWIWVLSPLWIGFAIIAVAFTMVFIVGLAAIGIAYLIDVIKDLFN